MNNAESGNEQQLPAEPIFDVETQASDGNPWQNAESNNRLPKPVHYWWIAFFVAISIIDSFLNLYPSYYRIIANGSFYVTYYGPHIVAYFLWAISSGIALFGVSLFFVRRRQQLSNVGQPSSSEPFPKYEGESLLLAFGAGIVCYLVLHSLPTHIFGSGASLWTSEDFFYVGYVMAAIAGLVILSLCWKRATRIWRIYICIEIISTVRQVYWQLATDLSSVEPDAQLIQQVYSMIPPIVLVGVALADLSRKRELPWTHWLGIGAYGVGSACSVLTRSWFIIWPYIQSNWPF